jgi:hypothetical protein
MKLLTLLSGAALLAGAGIALAQDGPGPDRHGPEGDVTRQQVIARVDEMFARIDANHDGRITPDEMQNMRGIRGMGGMRGMGEHRAGGGDMRQRMFDRIDANHDGMISREEFAQAHPGGPGREMGPPPGSPGGPDGHRMGARMFGEQGFVTLEQMRARALERFDRADANHDGVLTMAERQAARVRRQEREEPRQN